MRMREILRRDELIAEPRAPELDKRWMLPTASRGCRRRRMTWIGRRGSSAYQGGRSDGMFHRTFAHRDAVATSPMNGARSEGAVTSSEPSLRRQFTR